jgi:hypothetical protein
VSFYSTRSEGQSMEQLHYNPLYRWFVGVGVDNRVWVLTVFTKNLSLVRLPARVWSSDNDL